MMVVVGEIADRAATFGINVTVADGHTAFEARLMLILATSGPKPRSCPIPLQIRYLF
jgi:hypothetical protein